MELLSKKGGHVNHAILHTEIYDGALISFHIFFTPISSISIANIHFYPEYSNYHANP